MVIAVLPPDLQSAGGEAEQERPLHPRRCASLREWNHLSPSTTQWFFFLNFIFKLTLGEAFVCMKRHERIAPSCVMRFTWVKQVIGAPSTWGQACDTRVSEAKLKPSQYVLASKAQRFSLHLCFVFRSTEMNPGTITSSQCEQCQRGGQLSAAAAGGDSSKQCCQLLGEGSSVTRC